MIKRLHIRRNLQLNPLLSVGAITLLNTFASATTHGTLLTVRTFLEPLILACEWGAQYTPRKHIGMFPRNLPSPQRSSSPNLSLTMGDGISPRETTCNVPLSPPRRRRRVQRPSLCTIFYNQWQSSHTHRIVHLS